MPHLICTESPHLIMIRLFYSVACSSAPQSCFCNRILYFTYNVGKLACSFWKILKNKNPVWSQIRHKPKDPKWDSQRGNEEGGYLIWDRWRVGKKIGASRSSSRCTNLSSEQWFILSITLSTHRLRHCRLTSLSSESLSASPAQQGWGMDLGQTAYKTME